MKIKFPPALRVTVYVLNVLGAPLMAYLRAKNVIGDLEVTLWSAEIAAAFLLAGFHVPTPEAGEDGAADTGLLLLVLTFVGVVLLLFGVKFN